MNWVSVRSLAFSMVFIYPIMCQTPKSPKFIFSSLKNSIATVISMDGRGVPISQGSGVLIENNIIVTNYHVISTANKIIITLGHSKFSPISIKYNSKKDLAYLIFISPIGAPVNKGNSAELNVGDKIYTIGSPLGLDQTLSDGLISSFRHHENIKYIQTTAPISPGSSGGGLFNKNGKLIGITTFTMINGQNLNFAIPPEEIQPYSADNTFAIKLPIIDNAKSYNLASELVSSISNKALSVSEPMLGGLANGTIVMSLYTNTRLLFGKDKLIMLVRHTGDFSAGLDGKLEYAPDQEITIPLNKVVFTIESQSVPLGRKNTIYYTIKAISIDGSKCINSNINEPEWNNEINFIASKSKNGLQELMLMLNSLKTELQSY